VDLKRALLKMFDAVEELVLSQENATGTLRTSSDMHFENKGPHSRNFLGKS